MGYDRGEVLARIPLAGLCDELLGPHHGRGRTVSWPCPHPAHGPQTGKTPPVTIFQPRSGIARWHCHACGAGGTAIDLVMATEGTGFVGALELLARRAGVSEGPWQPAARPSRPTVAPDPPLRPCAVLEGYVSACEELLWSSAGRPMRRWLAGRGLREDVLRINRVGADPGPRVLRRDPGLPRGGSAVVLPLLDEQRRAVYLQARYLHPNGRKYDNPSVKLVPVSPRLGEMQLPGPARNRDIVLFCEGVPDALTAAGAGYRAVAILGAGLPDERLATTIVARHPDERLVVAFDADHRGRAGSERLVRLLAQADAAGRVHTLDVPECFGDLNGWAQTTPASFAAVLDSALHQHVGKDSVARTPQPSPVELTPPAGGRPELDDLLEALAYRHLLVDDQPTVAQNLEQIVDALSAWRSADGPRTGAAEGDLGHQLKRLEYRFLLDDEAPVALDRVSEVVDHWNALTASGNLDLPASLLPLGATPSEGVGLGL